MIKVLILGPYPYTETEKFEGGVLQVVMRLSEYLAKMPGIEVFVASKSDKITKQEIKKIGNLTVYFYPRIFPNFDWLLLKLGMYLSIKKILQNIKPDIIHSQGTVDCILTGIRFQHKIPHLVTIHGIVNNEFKGQFHQSSILQKIEAWFQKKCELYNFKRIKNLYCLSQEIKNAVTKINHQKINIFENNNPIDEQFFKIQRNHTEQKLPIILFVAAIVKRKGLHILLEAISKLISKNVKVQLRVVGPSNWDPEYVEELKQKYQSLIEQNYIQFLGGIAQERLLEEFSKAFIFVLPSLTETKPMVISQAMACGLPVITNPIGGIPEMIIHNQTGILLAQNTPTEIQENIERLLNDTALYTKISQQSKLAAENNYNPMEVAKQHVEIYKKLY